MLNSNFKICFFILFSISILKLIKSTELNEDEIAVLQELLIPKNLAENQTIRLNCALIQGKNVQLEWYFNNNKLQEDHRRKIKLNSDSIDLIIKQLQIDDLGIYKCIGFNELSKDEKEIDLNFPVKPKFIKEPEDVKSALLTEIILECKAKGQPFPSVEWFRLSEDKQTLTQQFKSNKINFKLTKETAGFYKCKIQNQLGEIEKLINVMFFGKLKNRVKNERFKKQVKVTLQGNLKN